MEREGENVSREREREKESVSGERVLVGEREGKV